MVDPNVASTAPLPRYAPIPKACDLLGFRRTKLYELAGAGSIRIVKVGGRALIDMEHALAWMATLPTAAIAPAHRPSRAASGGDDTKAGKRSRVRTG
jgi:excisionase family DNA binding protein